MSLKDSEAEQEPGWQPFDLFGQPVPANKGKRGRPQHAYNPEIFKSLIRCFGLGWSQVRVAHSHSMSVPTMNKVYFSTDREKSFRDQACDIYEAELVARLDRQSAAGSATATEKLLARVDRSRIAQLGEHVAARGRPQRSKPKGKKEELAEAAAGVGGRFAPRNAPPRMVN